MTLIKLEGVSKLYGFGDAATVALDEVSLTVNKGEFVAIMGPSGSGKSTLMHIIGLLDRPTHGKYYLNERAAANLRTSHMAKTRRDKIGFVFQAFNLLPKLNVLDNVALPLAYKGTTLVKRHKMAANVLEQVGLIDHQYYFPRHLSGGQIQRVAIARALVNNPSIVIADEPTGNLDSSASRVVMELLGQIHKNGTTVLLVTHNPELTRWANRVVYMQDGEIVYDEKSKIGEVAEKASQLISLKPKITEEDKLAGVSALMKAIPEKDTAPKNLSKRQKAKTKRRKTKARRR